MAPIRRYAEGTKVSIASSRAEIMHILAVHGVEKQATAVGPEGDQIIFELQDRQFRLSIAKPTLTEIRRMYPNAYDEQAKMDGEHRRRWRANVMLLKAKLEFIDSGDTTIEREMMPYMVTKGGQTIGELIEAGVPLLPAKAG